jgi:Fe-S-cluster containining protein
MPESFYRDGLRFACQRCSLCCRQDPGFVFLSTEDLDRLCEWAKISADKFIDEYCRWVPTSEGKEYLSLREKPNYDCVLWANGCLAYGYRPVQCSTYPFWPRILANITAWNDAAAECPGINKGELRAYEEIKGKLEEKLRNAIISRDRENA